ncbi:MAG: TraB/GumN family protein [Hyphomonadaceae bacterium]|nr:TraB/GumN family protein [Hyphomonadaceae bacterium]MBC6412802.1 TraB/GumN family protein [Hyphomonadaceae bacterium]
MWRFALLTMCYLLTAACGVGGSVDERVSGARTRNDGPPIWVVRDPDSELYLYGTVHLLPPELDWQRDDMREVFDRAGTIFFELDTGPHARLEAGILTRDLGQLSPGQRLSDRLDPYELKLLEAAANNGNIPYVALDSMAPWLASEFLTVAAAAGEGLLPDLAADEALKNRAERLRKNVIYLDDTERQIRASADQPEFVQMILLTEALERFNTMGPDLRRIAEAWAAGDTDRVRTHTVDTIRQKSPQLYSSLIRERNQDWTRKFRKFLEGGGTGLAAVGIAHLLGEDSIQHMLRDQGYTVSRYYAFQGENVIHTIELSINPAD